MKYCTDLTKYRPESTSRDITGSDDPSVVRYRFINPAEDEQEKFYEQKYLLNVPASPGDVILSILDAALHH